MNGDCDKLDAYLVGDLSSDAASAFGAHLVQCEECRTAVDEQRWIDGLLSSDELDAIERPRAAVLVGVREKIVTVRRRRRVVVFGLATAAAVLVAAGWLELNRRADIGAEGGVAAGAVAADARKDSVTFIAGSNAIAVPVASRHADVTVVRVYSAYQPAADVFTAVGEQPEPVQEDIWNDNFNGG